MTRYDSDPATAEQQLREASDAAIKAQDELDNAREMYDRIEQQWDNADSEDEKDHLLNTMQVIDNEITGLVQDLDEANQELSRTNDYWLEEDD